MISIIIPTYNEAGNIQTLINQISSSLKGSKFEIIIVDDNSPDKTWQVIKKLQKKQANIKLLHRINKKGLTSAFNDGIKKTKGSIIGWLDADLSHPPEYLIKMIKYFPDFDAVVASRYITGAKDDRKLFFPVLFSKVLNLFARIMLFKDLTDYTSGYILVKKEFLKKIPLKGDYGEYFIDLLFKLKKSKAKIKEIPYISINRVHGKSKTADNILGFFKRGKKYIIAICRLWLKK